MYTHQDLLNNATDSFRVKIVYRGSSNAYYNDDASCSASHIQRLCLMNKKGSCIYIKQLLSGHETSDLTLSNTLTPNCSTHTKHPPDSSLDSFQRSSLFNTPLDSHRCQNGPWTHHPVERSYWTRTMSRLRWVLFTHVFCHMFNDTYKLTLLLFTD